LTYGATATTVFDGLAGRLNQLSNVSLYVWIVPSVY
jgi:hypothetical protein